MLLNETLRIFYTNSKPSVSERHHLLLVLSGKSRLGT